MSRKQITIALGIAAVIVLAGIGFFFGGHSGPKPAMAGNAGFEILPTDRTLGNRNAKVVLIEYAAPVCPHCARFNANVIPTVRKNYVDTGKVLYVFRVYPLAPADGVAEKLARCLPQDKYFSFIDLLFRNQEKWDPEYAQVNAALQTPEGVRAGLLELARSEGMSDSQFDSCIASTAEDDRINKVGNDAQTRYHVGSTPSFVLDGTVLSGPYMREWNAQDMTNALDSALAKKS
ncbi:MAG TPA: thioredoxin domain-containing protein [Rhizomicrobium sp.]|jgi:protein-disulfide isomerase|nr:thioredoxin domain-containing protein [Rhizomicrobium sp.]